MQANVKVRELVVAANEAALNEALAENQIEPEKIISVILQPGQHWRSATTGRSIASCIGPENRPEIRAAPLDRRAGNDARKAAGASQRPFNVFRPSRRPAIFRPRHRSRRR